MMFASKAKWAAFGSPSFLLALDLFGPPGQSPLMKTKCTIIACIITC